MKTLTKRARIELRQMMQGLQSQAPGSTRKRLPGIPPEDLMEQAADRLEDSWCRRFFMTVAGFCRLIQVVAPAASADKIIELAQPWLSDQFGEMAQDPNLENDLKTIARQCLKSPNLNITLKRLTAILTQIERAHMARGLLQILDKAQLIEPEQEEHLVDLLCQVMLSKQAGMEIFTDWQQNRQIRPLLPGA